MITPNRRALQRGILLCTVVFVLFGLLIVYDVSVAESLAIFGSKFFVVKQQFIRAILGIVGMLLAMRIPAKWYKPIGPFVFLLTLALLVAVLIPGIGTSIGGARRWISLGPIVFQPSELAKIGVITYLSVWLLKPRRFLSFAMYLGFIFGLILLEPDLGSALIVSAISLGMYFVSEKPMKHFIWILFGGIATLLILIVVSPYRMQRLTTYLNPASDPLGKSYHIRQITIALGNGGLFGQGLGRSRQKYQYIPEAMTDSIFAVVAEEVGLVGCGMIIIGYIVLFTRMIHWVELIEDRHEQLMGVGIVTWLVAQTIVNLSSVVALIPLTGVPLLFISYGGSSLVSTLIAIGVLLSLGSSSSKRNTL